jgi:hypothetical protein
VDCASGDRAAECKLIQINHNSAGGYLVGAACVDQVRRKGVSRGYGNFAKKKKKKKKKHNFRLWAGTALLRTRESRQD